MDEANKSAMDVDGIGVLEDNIIDQQQTQSSKQDKKLNLSDFPKELLEQILIYLDDKSLLKASHVCKSFAAAAEAAFAQKYANQIYVFLERQNSLNVVMLRKYGDKMRNIYVDYEDKKLVHLIEQKCCNLKGIRLNFFKQLPRLKGLKDVAVWQAVFGDDMDLNRNTFTEFISNNPELRTLRIGHIENTLLESMDERLDTLESLSLLSVRYVSGLQKISLKSLKTLEIEHCDTECCGSIIQAMNCNAVKELRVEYYNGAFNETTISPKIIQEICTIKTLVSLRLHECGKRIAENQLRIFAIELPNLTDLSVKIGINESNHVKNILAVLPILPKLTKLRIKLNCDNFTELLGPLKMPIYEFHARFAKFNTEIEMDQSTVSLSNDYIILCIQHSDVYTFEVHWMNNLNESGLCKAIKTHWNTADKIRIINNCADQALDLSAFMGLNMNCTDSLDITSNGPITVNANATHSLGFFPRLNVLKIRLDNHSAIDFLLKLDKDVCKNIQELWLNTKGNQGYHGVEQDTGIISALAKFEKLESLHMNPSSVTFNVDHLFSVCPSIDDLQISRKW